MNLIKYMLAALVMSALGSTIIGGLVGDVMSRCGDGGGGGAGIGILILLIVGAYLCLAAFVSIAFYFQWNYNRVGSAWLHAGKVHGVLFVFTLSIVAFLSLPSLSTKCAGDGNSTAIEAFRAFA